MKRRCKSEHGAVTVFLAGALVIIIAFMGMLVDLARMRVAESQARRAAQLALDAVMTDYSRRLREDYGLFGYSGGDAARSNEKINAVFNEYMTANLKMDAEESSNDEFRKLIMTITGMEKLRYGDMLNMSVENTGTAGTGICALSDPDVMYQQILEFSKYRVPINMAVKGTLNSISEFTEKMDQIENDMEALELISKLADPTMKYYLQQEELSEALQKLDEALNDYNAAVKEWNKLISGEQEDRIDVNGATGDLSINVLSPKYSQYNGYLRYISGASWKADSYSGRISIDPVAYNLRDTVREFEGFEDGLVDDMVDASLADFKDALRKNRAELREVQQDFYDDYEDTEDGEVDAQEYYLEEIERINQLAQIAEDILDREEETAESRAEENARNVLSQMVGKLDDDLAAAAEPYKDEYSESKNKLDAAIDAVQKAIDELKAQGEKVQGSADSINNEMVSLEQKGEISEGIFEEWAGDQGDKVTTEKMLEEDALSIEKLEKEIGDLRVDLLEADGINSALNPGAVAIDFMNKGVIPSLNDGSPDWKAESHHMKQCSFTGSYQAAREIEIDEYDNKKKDAEKYSDNANKKLKEMEDVRDPERRYNSNRKIPDELKEGFITVGERNDSEYKNDLKDKKARDITAEEAGSANSGLLSGLEDLISAMDEGLQNILGIVYCSEYILNMFSNAAPAQDENKYIADEFEYARVVNLRNEYVTGAEMFEKLPETEKYAGLEGRLGYFYNAEVEYILFGKEREESNVTSAQVMLQLLLITSNYLQVRRNSELKIAVDGVAAAGAAFGIPPCVTHFLLFMVFATAEAQFDMFYLMRGYEIPMFSMDGDKLFMMNVGRHNEKILDAKGELMINYEFYLRLRLMMALAINRDEIMNRVANLIQLNINYAASEDSPEEAYPGDADFRIKGAYTSFNAQVSAKMPYWFMMLAMMGEARQGEGGYSIPTFEMVSSY